MQALLTLRTSAGLQSLSFKDCILADTTTTARHTADFLQFPVLSRLSLIRTSLTPGTSAIFLTPRTLPKLNSLTLSSCSIVEDTHSLVRSGPCEPADLLAHVRQLSLDGLDEDALSEFGWDRMTKLRQLSVPLVGADRIEIGGMPELSHLRVAAPSATGLLSRASSLNALQSAAAAAVSPHLVAAKHLLSLLTIDPAHPERGESTRRGLQHLTLPSEWRDRHDCLEPGDMRRTLERLGKACRAEGVRIRFDARRSRAEWKVDDQEAERGRHLWEPETTFW